MLEVRKLWGREKWVVNNELYCLKEMFLFQNACCSVHWHYKKDETFYVTVGTMKLFVGTRWYELGPGESIRIKPGWRHSFYGLTPCSFLEVSTHHEDGDVGRASESRAMICEDDWVRLIRNAYPV